MAATKKLYVGRLPRGCTSADLEEAFQKYGEVRFVDVKTDFGFVTFTDFNDAARLIDSKEKVLVKGVEVVVEFSHNGKNRDNDICFKCNQPGHWARNCPVGNPYASEHRPSHRDRSSSPPRKHRHRSSSSRSDSRDDRRRRKHRHRRRSTSSESYSSSPSRSPSPRRSRHYSRRHRSRYRSRDRSHDRSRERRHKRSRDTKRSRKDSTPERSRKDSKYETKSVPPRDKPKEEGDD